MPLDSEVLKQLRQEIRTMKPGEPLYEMLEEELTARKLWKTKQKPRGRAFPAGDEHPNKKRWQK